jgi:hypothetical protein
MGQVCSFSIKRQQRSAVPIPFMPDPGARMREYQGTTAHLAGVRRTGETRGSSLRETRVIAGDPGGGSPQKADTRPLSPCGRGRKIMVLVRERQVIDFSGEVEVSGVEPGPLSCKIYDLADAKLMILLSPPPRGRGCAQRLASKIHPHFHPHPPPPCHTFRALAAGWIANVSDQAGGRPFGICRNVRQVGAGGGGHRGSAGGRVALRRVQSQPPGRHPFSQAPSRRRETEYPVRACGGHGGPVWRARVRAGSSKTTHAVSPDRGRSNPGGGP